MKNTVLKNLLIALPTFLWVAQLQGAPTQAMDVQWMSNPLSSYMTKEQWRKIGERSAKEDDTRFTEAKVITIDTRDKKACENIKNQLVEAQAISSKQGESFCESDEQAPYISVIGRKEYQTRGIIFSELSEEQQEIVRQTRNFLGIGAGMMGLLYMLPEKVTKWDRDEIGLVGSKYKENIKAGPVFDQDDWAINYIGHPYSGAAYYVVARHAGLNIMSSFGYSVFMSTVFWEYGLEATAEVPSVQDLFVTPFLGALLGEAFIKMSEKIKENQGEIWGSTRVGSVALGLMDPAGAMLKGVNNIFENNFIKDSRTYFYSKPAQEALDPNTTFGVGLEFKF